MVSRLREPGSRYQALPAIAKVFRVLAYVVAIVGGLAVLVNGFRAMAVNAAAGLFVLILGLVIVVLYALTLLAFSEGIHVALDIEENTRRTAEALAAWSPGSPGPSSAGPGPAGPVSPGPTTPPAT